MSGASGYGTAPSGRTWSCRVIGMQDRLQCPDVRQISNRRSPAFSFERRQERHSFELSNVGCEDSGWIIHNGVWEGYRCLGVPPPQPAHSLLAQRWLRGREQAAQLPHAARLLVWQPSYECSNGSAPASGRRRGVNGRGRNWDFDFGVHGVQWAVPVTLLHRGWN